MSDHDQDRSGPAPELGGCLLLLLTGLGALAARALFDHPEQETRDRLAHVVTNDERGPD